MLDALDPTPNRLYTLKTRLIKEGRTIQDWVSGNVTEQGIAFPPELLQAAFQQGLTQAAVYHPDPLGQRVARESVSRFYQREGLSISPEQILLTPGTSLAYLFAFKLLAQPGDEFLCPTPNYPLFDSLATLADVRLTSYPLLEDHDWRIDLDALECAITPRTRAIVLISPHNPTGAIATAAELKAVAKIARAHNLAIVSDEVFSPFVFSSNTMPHPADTDAPLVLTLNGLSKMLALPGLKIAWMAVTGDAERVTRAMKRLDLMADTFLPVSEPTQQALPMILDQSGPFLKSYVDSIRERQAAMHLSLNQLAGVRVRKPEGGFYTVMKLLRGHDEDTACRILERANVLVHPGYFYDLAGEHLVVSHVGRPEWMSEKWPQVAAAISAV